MRDSTVQHEVLTLLISCDVERWSPARERTTLQQMMQVVHRCFDDPVMRRWHKTWGPRCIQERISKFGESGSRLFDEGHINGYCGKVDCLCHELLFEYFIYEARESGILSNHEAARAAIVIDDGLQIAIYISRWYISMKIMNLTLGFSEGSLNQSC